MSATNKSVVSLANSTTKELIASIGLVLPVLNTTIRGSAIVIDDTLAVATNISGSARTWAAVGKQYSDHYSSELILDLDMDKAIAQDLRKKQLAKAKRANSASVKAQ